MKKIIILLALIYAVSSCTNLDIAPESKLTDETTYKEKEELLNGLASVYASLGVWSEIVHKGGASTDEMIFPARGGDWKGDLQDVHLHKWKYDNGEIGGLYTGISKVIAVCNTFIADIERTAFANDEDVQIIKSEARFVRAFAYFLMVDYFGKAPLVTTSAYDPMNPPAQNSRVELYDFVEKELKEVSDILPQSAVYGRMDKYAAKALLAKLYLNAEVFLGSGKAKWSEVASLTKDIMDNSTYKLENNFKDVFKWDNFNSKEIIFALVCDSRISSPENISYLFTITDLREKYGSFASGWNGAATLPTFYKSFDEKDIRREMFLAGPQVDVNGNPIIAQDDAGVTRQLTYYVDFTSENPVNNADHWDGARGVKYLMDGIGGTMEERGLNNDMPILRFADILLMRAEALFRLNPADAEALSLVNQVRTRNGHNPITALTALTEDNLLAERGREFAWEGWRRNDLIRFDKWGDAWDYKEASDAKYKLFPIPKVQMDANPNLEQNTGY